jgi:alpha-tubulin suppressor-like RCC1 family protein
VFGVGDNSTGNLGYRELTDVLNLYIPRMVDGLDNVTVTNIEAGHFSACITNIGELFLWGAALDPNKPLLFPTLVQTDNQIK